VLGADRPAELRAAALGLWAFTNLELAQALLRVDERAREYATAALVNVALTVGLTVWLVVVRDEGALGLLLGNFGASTLVLLGLWVRLRDAFGAPDRALLGPMLRFGLPTVPAEVSVFAIFFVDRLYLYRAASEAEAGLYALSVKLAAGVVFSVRAFQYAWPPLAYSITDDDEARRVYARITTYYVLFTGLVVAVLALVGRWVVRLLAAPEFFDAHEALPWVGLGWALYGLFLVLVAMAGRAQVTVRNFPAALCGLAANVVLLVLLVGPLGIAGAGVALCGAYVVMIAVMYALTRSLFRVEFEWGRLALVVAVVGAITVAAELLTPTEGLLGLAVRLLALALAPAPALASGLLRVGRGGGGAPPRRALRGLARPLRVEPRVVRGGGLADALPASRPQRRGDVAGVAARVVTRQGDGDDRTHGVGPRRERAHGGRGEGGVVLAHVAVAVARELDDPPLPRVSVESCSWWIARASGTCRTLQPASRSRLQKSTSSE
jgi:O-antigen/teichoic acid export membrane protein